MANFHVWLQKAYIQISYSKVITACFSLNDTNDTALMDVESNQGFRECVDHWEAFWSGLHQELIAEYSLLGKEE